MIGLGHDLQLISEVAAATGLREPDVFFTAGELRRFASSVAPLKTQAGAFAAKEALFKALPATGETWFWTDAELVADARGKPRFHLHGALARHLTRQHQQVVVSISHSGGFASATVLVTRDGSVVAPSSMLSTGWSDVYFGETSYLLEVRPNDLDALGHVNNAVALEYLEAGRWDWMRRQKLTPGTGVIAVVERIDITYHAEIPCGQVEVRTVLTSPTAAEFDWEDLTYRARFAQRLHLSGEASPAVAALVTVAFIDARRRCPVSMQEFFLDAGARRSITPSNQLSGSRGGRNE